MSRLVEDCSCSDEELPELGVLLGHQTDSVQSKRSRSPTAAPPKKERPNNTSSTPKRRVRRLGSDNRDAINPLFRPWNRESENKTNGSSHMSAKGPSSKRRPVLSRGVKTLKGYEQPQNQSTDNPSSRQIRIDLQLDTSSIQQPISQPKNTSATRSRALGDRRVRNARVTVESLPEENNGGSMEKLGYVQPTNSKGYTPMQENLDSCPGGLITSDENEESLYQTATEESSEYSDGDQSDDGSFKASFDACPVELVFADPRKTPGAKSKQSPGPYDSVLMPCHPDLKSREVKRDDKVTTDKPVVPENSQKRLGELADTFSQLQLHFQDSSDEPVKQAGDAGFTASSLTPQKSIRKVGLVSPRKQARIPDTPHRPSIDAFWSQDFVDDWNDRHSPRKPARPRLPAESSVKVNSKETKRLFEARKHQLAEDFLGQLDAQITDGQIARLAESTGGVKIVWTKTLNTTAGRANWRRETIRSKQMSGGNIQQTVQHKHHASIELAEKVIDDEDRLLNVLAHEFCHLANFMVNGITNNPHGKEFKVWAAKCSRAFGAQGIKVTTKHTYEIDFKYIWTCTACGSEYKRHSKSIDPQRHRCGSCKGALRQTKPVPRGAGAGGKPSEYQVFMKEQMKIVRSENPGSPQKEVMKIIADRWAKRDRGKNSKEAADKVNVNSVVAQLVDLSLEE